MIVPRVLLVVVELRSLCEGGGPGSRQRGAMEELV